MSPHRLFAAVLATWVASFACAQGSSSLSTPSPTATPSPTLTPPPTPERKDGWDAGDSCDHDNANAVLFPFVFLALGAATLWLTSRYAPDLPYTVIMLVEGFLIVSDSECSEMNLKLTWSPRRRRRGRQRV